MKTKLIIDGNAVYEIDEECLECRKRKEHQKKQEESSRSRPAHDREHSRS